MQATANFVLSKTRISSSKYCKLLSVYYSILLDFLGHDRIEELPPSIPSTDMPDGFSFRLVKTTYVKLAINNLLNSESVGGDRITSRIIKISSPAIIDALLRVFNSSLLCGMLQFHLK